MGRETKMREGAREGRKLKIKETRKKKWKQSF